MAPLSFAQQRLWFLDQYEPGNAVYTLSLTLSLRGALRQAALEQSLNELVRRHEALRTTFSLRGSQPEQHIAPASALALAVSNLSALPEAGRESEALRLAGLAAQQPFDLATGPLIRANLWRLSDDDHLLLLSAHQIVADEPSMRVLARELGEFYDAFAQGHVPPLPEHPAQYADIARREREAMQGQYLESLLTYWKGQLADAPPLLILPTDHPRPARQSYRGARQGFTLPAELTRELHALSEREGVPLFMTLLSAFNTLLYRYTGQADISVGTFSPLRQQQIEHDDVIGPLSNALVLRTAFAEDATFRALLGQVWEAALGAYAHQELPFEKLVEELNPARDLSHSPLFQAMFVLKPPLPAPQHLSGLQVSILELDSETTSFDLTLEIVEGPDGLSGVFEYATDLFEAPTIARAIGHFQTLLEGIAAAPDQRVSSLPLLTDPERRQLLIDWNNTDKSIPSDKLFSQLFEAQVERVPHAPAAACEDERVSYQELNRRANRLARLLVKEGIGPDVLVALLAERSINFLTAMLAVFKAGGAYLPLDPLHPAKRLTQVLSQSSSALVLTTGEFLPVLSQALAEMPGEARPSVLLIEDMLKQEQPDDNLLPRCTSNDLAYVIYTSGSTGMPKGAMVEQRGMLNHLYAKIIDLQLTEKDSVAETASQCFDISVWQFLSALVLGGNVHIFKDDIAHDALHLLKEVEQQNISILETVPSLLRAMLEEERSGGLAHPKLSALRWLIPTGEALPPELGRQWLHSYPAIPMVNAYGPTECSDDVTHYPIHEPPAPDVMRMPIGRPIINMQMYVLNAQLQPVPIGVVGELYVGGIGVGRGYLNAPEKTAEAFLVNPFAQGEYTRLYKTGDLARYLPDGNLEYVGRADHMVKVRGFRIEPGEIEATLKTHPAVEQVVVLAKAGPSGDTRLVAYVVPQPSYREPQGHAGKDDAGTELIPQLRAFLQDRLPEYMVPSAFVALDAMPLNSNGKIDRKALPEPQVSSQELDSAFVAPRTPVEEIIAEQWKQVLGVERVGVLDDFFALQGHSLLAAHALSRVHEAFQIDLPLRAIFEAPTVAGLAEKVEQKLLELVESLSDEEALSMLGEN